MKSKLFGKLESESDLWGSAMGSPLDGDPYPSRDDFSCCSSVFALDPAWPSSHRGRERCGGVTSKGAGKTSQVAFWDGPHHPYHTATPEDAVGEGPGLQGMQKETYVPRVPGRIGVFGLDVRGEGDSV
jgi:hypothetical protein